MASIERIVPIAKVSDVKAAVDFYYSVSSLKFSTNGRVLSGRTTSAFL
jgi:hypothetical protein